MASVHKHKKGLQPAYRIFWRVNGVRYSMIFRGNKTMAKKKAYELESSQHEIKASEPLVDLLEKYKDHLKGLDRSPKTIKRYEVGIQSFIDYMPAGLLATAVTNKDIEEYKIDRNKSVNKISVNIDLRSIRAFFNFLYQYQYIDKNPFRGIKMFKSESNVKFLSPVQLKRLGRWIFEHEGEDEADLISMYLITGARAIELLPPQFLWTSVLEDRLLIKGKYNKERYILLNDSIRKILDRRKAKGEKYPFDYSYNQVYDLIVRKILPSIGVKDASIQTLRATTGVILIQQGVDIYRVSKYLGHSSVMVTEKHYVDILRKDYQEMSDIITKTMF